MNPHRRGIAASAVVFAAIVLGFVFQETLLGGTLRRQTTAAEGIGSVDGTRIARADEEPGNWYTVGRTFSEQRFSPLAQITQENVDALGFAWEYDMRTTRPLEASPVVVDGTMYASGNWGRVHAVNAATGEEMWSYDPRVPGSWARKACCGVVNRGLAVWKGSVYVGSLDGRLIRLDATTGEPLWEQDTLIDRQRDYTITSAPRIVRDRVIIGNSGAEYGVRGYISAYDTASGELAWRFYTVPADPSQPFEHPELEMAAATWDPQSLWEFGGGGTVWGGMAYDPELNLLYVGTGNASPYPVATRSPAGGDNLFLASILAIDPDTGRLAWHYQTTPGENWDYTATANLILAEMEIDGRQRRVIMQAPKNGFFYVIDRATGELLSAEPYVTVNWASHVDLETGRPIQVPAGNYDEEPKQVSPSWWGGHNWHPMAFSPMTGLVYIPTIEWPTIFARVPDPIYRPGQQTVGVTTQGGSFPLDPPVEDAPHALKAWDPVANREVWRVGYRFPYNGGLLATAGNLVFQGTVDGRLKAYAADTGAEVANIEVGTSIMAAPVAFLVDGTQYIAVEAGYGGGANARPFPEGSAAIERGNAGRIIAFKLGGGGVPLPPLVDPRAEIPLPSRPDASPETLAEGGRLYRRFCADCHRIDDHPTVAPNLLRMDVAVHDVFERIVLEGLLEANGMPDFGREITADEVEEIHAFLVETAHDVRGIE